MHFVSVLYLLCLVINPFLVTDQYLAEQGKQGDSYLLDVVALVMMRTLLGGVYSTQMAVLGKIENLASRELALQKTSHHIDCGSLCIISESQKEK